MSLTFQPKMERAFIMYEDDDARLFKKVRPSPRLSIDKVITKFYIWG